MSSPLPAEPSLPDVPDAPTPEDRPDASAATTAPTTGQGVPAVVAVVTTRDPGPAFDETLESLAAQDYPSLNILVIDAGSADDPRPRVAATAPSAFVRRIEPGEGFAAAADQVLGSVEGAAFYLFCHDDAALAPGSVQALVSEAFRSNAGIVGAKLVDWERPDRLRSVGARIDRFAYPAPISEPDELDQAQHDVAQEVFVVSAAAMLVRADLFADLAGFDPTVDLVAAELDLCWRARVAGARTVIAPAAVARHLGHSPIADPDALGVRHATRAQARALFTCASASTLLRVLPVAMVFSLLDLLLNLVTGRFRQAGDIAGAWVWNVAHLPRTLRARRRTQQRRRSSDREIAAQQVRGSARLSAYVRRARSSGEIRLPAAIAAARGLPAQWHDGSGGLAVMGLVIVALTLLIGSRGLVTGGVAALREMAPLDDPRALMSSWWTGWRPTGFGHASPGPLLHLVLGVADRVTLASTGFVRTALVLVPLLLGPVGAWRMLRTVASARARLAATVAYAVTPVAIDAVATGRLGAIALYGALPWMVGGLLRISGGAPTARRPSRGPVRAGVGLGLVTAAAMLVVPIAVLVLLGVAAVIVVVEVVTGGFAAARRVAVATGVAAVAAILVHLPSVLDVLSHPDRWSSPWVGGPWTESPSFGRLLQLSVGPTPGGWLYGGLVLAAGLVLLVGKGWRLRWGAIGWGLALGSWATVVLLTRWGTAAYLPPLATLLVPAAVGLALAVGAGVAAFESDVMGSVFGWRQVASAFALVALALSSLPFLVAASDGRWRSPSTDVMDALRPLDEGDGQFRTLWLGAPDDLPGAAEVVGKGVALLVTTGTVPTFDTVFSTPIGDAEAALVDRVELLLSGDTRTIGASLANLSVDQVVVLRSADGRSDRTSATVEPLLEVLAEQLDLRPVDVAPGIDVFRSTLAQPVRGAVAPASPVRSQVLDRPAGLTGATGDVPADAEIVVGLQGGRWELRVDGATRDRVDGDDWTQRFAAGRGGSGSLTVTSSGGHRAMVIAQLVAIVLLAAVAGGARRPEPPLIAEVATDEEVAA